MKANALPHNHRLAILLYTSLGLAFIAQYLFMGRPLGISWLLFTTIITAALIWHGHRAGLHVTRHNLWLWPPLFFFATMIFLRANPFLTFLNIGATLGLLAFIYFYYASGSAADLPLAGIFALPWRMAGTTIANVTPVLSAGLQPLTGTNGKRRELAPVIRGGALALPVVFVFTLLLASADLVFSARLQNLVGIDFATVAPYLGRALFTIFVALLVAGGTATAILRGIRQSENDESWLEQTTRKLPLHISIGSVESATILSLVCALFLLFVILQFTYLFGGQANIGREGFTFAEYARRGFFELVLVASLSLAMILTLNWLTRRESKGQIRSFNLFSSLLILLVLLILAAAFYRMRLYEQAYGYTELRLIVLIFELWLTAVLLWFLITLWRAPERFPVGLLVAAIGFVATLNLVNPDTLIVRHNLERYQTSGDLDVVYLTTLSTDAVPGLLAAYEVIEEDDQLITLPYCYDDECETTMPELLADNLTARYQALNEVEHQSSLLAYHHSRNKAHRSLVDFFAQDAPDD